MTKHCPNHGPYEGASCPYDPPHGDENRPGEPSLLDDEAATDLGDRSRGRFYGNGDDPTEVPDNNTRRNNRILDDDGESTQFGRGRVDELDVTELESPALVTQAILWEKIGRRPGRTIPIRHGWIVGRNQGKLMLDDPKVSGQHAKFTVEGDKFVIWDLGSVNGTYVNGKRIREATVLDENDLLKIGDTVFVVKLLEPRAKKKVAAPAPKARKTVANKAAPAKKPSRRR